MKHKKHKNDTDYKQIYKNVIETFKEDNNLLILAISALGFLLLYTFFYGLWVFPIIDFGFWKTTPFSFTDGLYVVSASLLSGAMIPLYMQAKKNNTTKGIFSAGIFGGAFGVFCPACLGINLLFLGNVTTITSTLFLPFLKWIQAASVSLLAFGLWNMSKGIECKTCVVKPKKSAKKKKTKSSIFGKFSKNHEQAIYTLLGITIVMFIYQITPLFGIAGAVSAAAPAGHGMDTNNIISQVLPEQGFTLDATWGTTVSDMVDAGVLDPVKLESILTRRYGQEMKPEWTAILNGEDAQLSIDAENSVFMMYLLWTLGKHNDNSILRESRIANYFDNYDIGVGRAGYSDVLLFSLTPEQQDLATEISMNSYRPCCGNPAGVPDCSHGFAALGLIELMAAQGYEKDEIYDSFIKINSFWFPSTYIQNALFFQITEGKSWDETDDELMAGKEFSSIAGSRSVKKYLQNSGL